MTAEDKRYEDDPCRSLCEDLFNLRDMRLPDRDANVEREITIKTTSAEMALQAGALTAILYHLNRNSPLMMDFWELLDPLTRLQATLAQEVTRNRQRGPLGGRPTYNGDALRIRPLALAAVDLLVEHGMKRLAAGKLVTDTLREGGLTIAGSTLVNWERKWIEEGSPGSDGGFPRKALRKRHLEKFRASLRDGGDAVEMCRSVLIKVARTIAG